MIWGIVNINQQIAQAAIDELYCLDEITAADRLEFFNRHGVHFSTKEEIKAVASQFQLAVHYHRTKNKNKLNDIKLIEAICDCFNESVKPHSKTDSAKACYRDFII